MSDTANVPITAVTWFEIPASDMSRAQRFYETILESPLRRENFAGSDIVFSPHRTLASKAVSWRRPNLRRTARSSTSTSMAGSIARSSAFPQPAGASKRRR